MRSLLVPVATRRSRRHWLRAGAGPTGRVLAIVGLIAAGATSTWFSLREPADPPAVPFAHIHGVAADPAAGDIVLATHAGLARIVRPDAAEALGRARLDTIGFALVGRTYLGSGHDNAGRPLGLVQSRDKAETWNAVSLRGSADFHVLRARDDFVYGFDETRQRLLMSRDEGRRWTVRPLPGALVDLAIDPRDPRSLIASTTRKLFASSDAGRTWRPLADRVGFLSWARAYGLYLVDAEGQLFESPDRGRTWRRRGAVRAEPAAFTVAQGGRLVVALHGGRVLESTDGGRSWVRLFAPLQAAGFSG